MGLLCNASLKQLTKLCLTGRTLSSTTIKLYVLAGASSEKAVSGTAVVIRRVYPAVTFLDALLHVVTAKRRLALRYKYEDSMCACPMRVWVRLGTSTVPYVAVHATSNSVRAQHVSCLYFNHTFRRTCTSLHIYMYE